LCVWAARRPSGAGGEDGPIPGAGTERGRRPGDLCRGRGQPARAAARAEVQLTLAQQPPASPSLAGGTCRPVPRPSSPGATPATSTRGRGDQTLEAGFGGRPQELLGVARLAIRFLSDGPLSSRRSFCTVGAAWTDRAPNVSRLDPPGAVQFNAEHPSRNRKVVGSNPTPWRLARCESAQRQGTGSPERTARRRRRSCISGAEHREAEANDGRYSRQFLPSLERERHQRIGQHGQQPACGERRRSIAEGLRGRLGR
jgi:hypothetical protein